MESLLIVSICFLLVLQSSASERLETLSDLVSHHLVGSAFSLTCLQPEPDSNSSIAWYYNNIPLCLQDSSERRDCNPPPGPSTDNGTLFFSAVRLDQAGWYTCSASSRALGRRETDFLVIIQEPPGLGFNFTREYVVFENSTRVELPCTVMKGQPHPNIMWFTTNLTSMTVVSVVDQNTGSLIILNSRSSLNGSSFRCEASNVVNNETNSVMSSDVILTVRNPGDDPRFQSAFTNLINNSVTALYFTSDQLLNCTLSDTATLQDNNLTVVWSRDSQVVSQTNEQMTESSGFYCCEVLDSERNDETVLTVCATIVVEEPPVFTPPPPVVSFPTNRNAILLCLGPASDNIYAPLSLSWEGEEGTLNSTAGLEMGLELSDKAGGLSYLRETEVGSVGVSRLYSCVMERTINDVEQIQRESTIITTVDICSSENALSDLSDGEEVDDIWNFSGDAFYQIVNFESVFAIEGNGSIQQTISVPNSASFLISGRVRQNATVGRATIRVMSNQTQLLVLQNPDSQSSAWQWVSSQHTFIDDVPTTLTVVLELDGGGEEEVAFFDDICLSFEPESAQLFVAVLSAAAGALILMLLLIIIISRCLCSCKCCDNSGLERKKSAVLMSRVTNTLLRKWKKHEKDAAKPEVKELTIMRESGTATPPSPVITVQSPETPLQNFKPGRSCYYKEETPRTSPVSIPPPQVNGKIDEIEEEEEEQYVNEGCFVPSASRTPIASASPPVLTVSIGSSPRVGSPPTVMSPGAKAVIDFGEGDFAYVDPKVLVTDSTSPASPPAEGGATRRYSTSNIRQNENKLHPPVQRNAPQRRSTGDIEKEVYTYVSPEVEWALGRSLTPVNPRLSSSDEEEEEESLYANEPRSSPHIDTAIYENEPKDDDVIYQNEIRVPSRKT